MNLYDTRFFFEHYYSDDGTVLEKTRALLRMNEIKYISAITVHEVYKISLEREGKEVANIRTTLLEKEFEVIPVEAVVAKRSAELRGKYRMPMADSMVAASTELFRLRCVSDDPHIRQVREIESRWI